MPAVIYLGIKFFVTLIEKILEKKQSNEERNYDEKNILMKKLKYRMHLFFYLQQFE